MVQGSAPKSKFPDSPTKPEAGLKGQAQGTGLKASSCPSGTAASAALEPFLHRGLGPVLHPLPAVLPVLWGPLTHAPLSLSSEILALLERPESSTSSFFFFFQHFLFSQQRVVCLSHGIISECEPALHLHFILARPQSVHLCRTRFCSRGSREYLTAGPAPSAWERQAPHEAELGGSCRCWLSIPAPPRLVVPILLAFLRAGCGCSSFGRHIRAPCKG